MNSGIKDLREEMAAEREVFQSKLEEETEARENEKIRYEGELETLKLEKEKERIEIEERWEEAMLREKNAVVGRETKLKRGVATGRKRAPERDGRFRKGEGDVVVAVRL